MAAIKSNNPHLTGGEKIVSKSVSQVATKSGSQSVSCIISQSVCQLAS